MSDASVVVCSGKVCSDQGEGGRMVLAFRAVGVSCRGGDGYEKRAVERYEVDSRMMMV